MVLIRLFLLINPPLIKCVCVGWLHWGASVYVCVCTCVSVCVCWGDSIIRVLILRMLLLWAETDRKQIVSAAELGTMRVQPRQRWPPNIDAKVPKQAARWWKTKWNSLKSTNYSQRLQLVNSLVASHKETSDAQEDLEFTRLISGRIFASFLCFLSTVSYLAAPGANGRAGCSSSARKRCFCLLIFCFSFL